ncbi:hypothetical protein CUMW_065780 [Citrus unshiu]|nr:hypothetical protein CUMW_065780 [Citrus unshiu]
MSNFDESQWIDSVRGILKNGLGIDTDLRPSIFTVPKTLMSSDPDSYTPQQLAIGPYHYWRPGLYEMERYKLAAAIRAETYLLGNHKFEYVVDQLEKHVLRIRACYQKVLTISNEALAWMMAIDASFLLEFLMVYAMKEGKVTTTYPSKSMSHLSGTKAALNTILRDLVMLENQIPLFVLRKMLEVEYSSLEAADEMLQAMLIGFCEELSPFKMMKDTPLINVSECQHLLDYLYDTIVPNAQETKVEITVVVQDQSGEAKESVTIEIDAAAAGDPTSVKKLFSLIWKYLSKVNFVKRLPWGKLSKALPGISLIVQMIQQMIPGKNGKEKSDDDSDMNKPPLMEEITIPSVTELANSLVHFRATTGDISTVRFDAKKRTLHLPTISFDVNTEVILRNLVAYEASYASGPLVFTRYTELMNGIIDSEEDVKLLREKGIILNRLKSDAEVANLWNGMSKSIRLTKVPHIDKAIEGVNKYYNRQWNVKFRKNMRAYVFGSWKCLTFLAAITLLFLTMVQSFCSVYNCRKFKFVSGSSSVG